MQVCVFVVTFGIFTYLSQFHRDRFPKKRDKICWLTVEQQFNPALVVTSAFTANAIEKNRHQENFKKFLINVH
jgi:heme/copper-type cytochrome/quinol oxidase subunit 3